MPDRSVVKRQVTRGADNANANDGDADPFPAFVGRERALARAVLEAGRHQPHNLLLATDFLAAPLIDDRIYDPAGSDSHSVRSKTSSSFQRASQSAGPTAPAKSRRRNSGYYCAEPHAFKSVIRMIATTRPSLTECSSVSLLQVQTKSFLAVKVLPSCTTRSSPSVI
jgi:hypothetical protein